MNNSEERFIVTAEDGAIRILHSSSEGALTLAQAFRRAKRLAGWRREIS